jgi:hypothetical protein
MNPKQNEKEIYSWTKQSKIARQQRQNVFFKKQTNKQNPYKLAAVRL